MDGQKKYEKWKKKCQENARTRVWFNFWPVVLWLPRYVKSPEKHVRQRNLPKQCNCALGSDDLTYRGSHNVKSRTRKKDKFWFERLGQKATTKLTASWPHVVRIARGGWRVYIRQKAVLGQLCVELLWDALVRSSFGPLSPKTPLGHPLKKTPEGYTLKVTHLTPLLEGKQFSNGNKTKLRRKASNLTMNEISKILFQYFNTIWYCNWQLYVNSHLSILIVELHIANTSGNCLFIYLFI